MAVCEFTQAKTGHATFVAGPTRPQLLPKRYSDDWMCVNTFSTSARK